LNGETRQCEHDPKVLRYTIDSGLGEIIFLELCQACRIISYLKYIIKTEMINLE